MADRDEKEWIERNRPSIIQAKEELKKEIERDSKKLKRKLKRDN